MEFMVHNVAHHPKTRLARYQAPVHPRHKQFILKTQRRLIPNRPIEVTEAELFDNLDELKSLNKQGIVEVRTKSGEIVDLEKMTIQEKNAEPAKPKFRLDSAQNDPPRGKSAVFTPDTTEKLDAPTETMAGGGMTPEAMAQADEDNRLPPLPEELKHLEGEMEQGLTAKDMTPQDEADMARAFAEDDEEEPEIEHQEKPKTQTRRR